MYEVERAIEGRMNHWRETVKSLTTETETDIINCLKACVREQELKEQEMKQQDTDESNCEGKSRYLPSCSSKCAIEF